MTPTRILVVDDQPDVRVALVDLLATDPDIEVVGSASTVQEAITQAAGLAPNVVLMDVKMPDGGGARATRVIRQSNPDARIVASRPTRTARPSWRCSAPARSAT